MFSYKLSWLCTGAILYIVLTCRNASCYANQESQTGCKEGVCPLPFSGKGYVVTIYCQLRLLVAKANVERTKRGQPALSLRRLAEESGVSLSVLASLHTEKRQRIDYTTIDHLLTYFNQYFRVTAADLLVWEQEENVNITAS